MRKAYFKAKDNTNKIAFPMILDYFEDLEKANKDFEHISSDETLKYQEMAFNNVLDYARENNKFYGKRIQNLTFSELDQIPLLLKEDIRGEKNLIQCVPDKQIGQLHLTSGTTGKPTYISYTLADQFIYDLLPQYNGLFPFGSEDVVGIALPYEFALPALGFQRLFQFVFGSMVLSLGKGGYMAPVDKALDLLKEYQPSVITTTPSYAALLYDEAVSLGFDPKDFKIERFILTGEGCSFNFRKQLEDKWNCKMTFFYGSTEIGLIAKECIAQNGYHICEGHVFVEILDKNGKTAPDGEMGDIVVSTLLREGMPMIRYNTEDKGFTSEEKCDCGCGMKKLFLFGRERDQIHLEDGKFPPLVLENVLLKSKLITLWYQFIIENHELTVRCEKQRHKISDNEVITEIKKLFKDNFGINCEVEITNDIPKHKGKNQRVFYKK
ncbi:phenylacetate--CoA ligase family protein [Enterococcus rotai]|uniref:phenylacetate--CoA ligase family protein n=1 Tax=Enterococcus rotai TaxID=118060 RepID=UPI0035C69E33